MNLYEKLILVKSEALRIANLCEQMANAKGSKAFWEGRAELKAKGKELRRDLIAIEKEIYE